MNQEFHKTSVEERTGVVSRSRPAKTALAVAVAISLAGGGAIWASAKEVQPLTPTAPVAPALIGLPGFADVVERVTPAVVNVKVTSDTTRRMGRSGHMDMPRDLPIPEPFRHFFDEQGQMAPHLVEGQGSGFLVDPQGFVVTNNHVIDGASQVTVVLNDGAEHQARVVGRDDKSDLALLKIETSQPLPYVELGDSSKARVGDWVLAVGNPFGLGGSVNAGIISARGRDIHAGPYDDYLQIDAAINRGNSGGPLFDTTGHVIGVNTAIYSPTGGNVGIGFAIPAETVRQVVADLRDDGRVERGWLGLQIQEVTPELAAGLGLERPEGVLVADVVAGGPASGTDLQAGDVIVRANGHQLESYRELPKLVAATKAGTRMQLEVLRRGKPLEVAVTVGQMPGDEGAVAAQDTPEQSGGAPRLGLYLALLTPDVRAQNGLSADQKGVLVAQVERDSPAAKAGIEPGSLISMVGAEPVDSPDQIVAAARKAADEGKQALIMRVERGGRTLFVAVPLAA
ncbi:DegQ family serine endoprotease [Thiocystis violacea]|uniref:DegQ family serine endoprotease n=1 Tax=Thiocystis violacea TaxID=13725 RepID=UPI001905BEDD|nr:DegQ family serine endoprotease [Thiocystis violacea]MBK1721695.1 serine protease [Thiocystis violacea]